MGVTHCKKQYHRAATAIPAAQAPRTHGGHHCHADFLYLLFPQNPLGEAPAETNQPHTRKSPTASRRISRWGE